MIRHPYAGAAQMVAGWTEAAVVNAGDGKHEHPSQALLDVFTLRRRLGSLEGKQIWIVGDVLHSRVARSNLLAFQRMGAEVTVCGPPTLIPRGIEELGCEVAHSLDGLERGRRRLRAADAARADERELRPLAARVRAPSSRSTRRRLGPRQLLMHPGPVNRGVEISGEAIDSPQSLIAEQVAAGLVVRMAILYELLAGGERAGRRPGRRRRRRPRRPRSGSPHEPSPTAARRPRPATRPRSLILIRRATRARPGRRDRRRPRRRRPRRRDRRAGRARRGRAPRAPRWSRPRACTPSPPSSTRTSTCAPPARSTRRTSRPAPAPPPPAATAGSSRWPTPQPPVSTAADIAALREQARAGASVPVGFMATVTRGMQGEELTEMVELREAGAVGFTDDGLPIAAPGSCAAPSSTSASAAARSPCTRRTPSSPATASCTRARSRRRSASPASPRSRSRR